MCLFAVPGKPETCPFQGRYSFSYMHNGKGPCSNPQSEIHACADESKFKFIYKACPGIPNTKERGNISKGKSQFWEGFVK